MRRIPRIDIDCLSGNYKPSLSIWWFIKSLFCKNKSKYLEILSPNALNDLKKYNEILIDVINKIETLKEKGIEIDVKYTNV